MRKLGEPGGQNETVLIQGTGGVSIMGLMIAKASGSTGKPSCFKLLLQSPCTANTHQVIITSSSDEKLKRAKALGADHLINYRTTPDWDAEVLRLTDDVGVDNIFENGGAMTTSRSFNCIRFGGLINAIGYVSGKFDPPDQRLNINVSALSRNMTIKGLINGPRDRFVEMLDFCAKHEIRPVVDRVFAFDQAREALQYLWDGSHFGKVVIKVAG